MKLYLCEKKLQAKDIAEVLGKAIEKKGYFSLADDINVTWAKGHLFQLNNPEDYNQRFKRWLVTDLPISPDIWKKKPRFDTKHQLKIIQDLAVEADHIFIATDLDREGESIAKEILAGCKTKAVIQRIRITALDPDSIKTALNDARHTSETETLAFAADARQKADWLVGMNLTRLYTLIAQKHGLQETFHVGRVAVPTIALVVNRENEIEEFTPEPYYKLKALCDFNGEEFAMEWISPEEYCDDKKRCILKPERDFVNQSIFENKGEITFSETGQKITKAPLPFDLNSIQSLACGRWNYTAKQVLKGLQSLYEKHRLITYPRTENRYLPSHFYAMVPDILKSIAYSGKTGELIISGVIEDNVMFANVFDDEQVSIAHHAIIPTRKKSKLESLNELEARLYLLVSRYFVAQFYPPHIKDAQIVKGVIAGNEFKFTRSKTTTLGWRTVLGKNLAIIIKANEEIDNDEEPLIDIAVDDVINVIKNLPEDHMTTPPDVFTEATLINAMKRIGRFVDDEEVKKVLDKSAGIGTASTRADIIETAINREYLKRDKHRKRIHATEKGHNLIAILPKMITSPGITAQWELKLQQVESGELDSDTFVKEINRWLDKLIMRVKNTV